MIRYAAVAIFLLSGCFERPQNEVVEGPPGHAAAVAVANGVLVEYELRPIQPGLVDVTWMSGDCLDSDSIDGCMDGAQYGLCTIWLIMTPESTWSFSSFAHEMIHCSIFDGAHADPIWPELVRAIRERLADAGL